MPSSQPRCHLIATLLALLLSAGQVGVSFAALPATDLAQTGWEALWSNDYAQAEHYFSAALSTDGDDQSARRGRILTALALGRDDIVLDEVAAYGERAPSSEYDFFVPGLVRQLSDMDSRDFHEVLARFSDKLAGAKSVPPVDRRMFAGLASRQAYLSGDAGMVERSARGLNRMGRWCVLGPFDNTSGSGHRQTHVDPAQILADPYEGKFGQPIMWFSPQRISLDRSIAPPQYFEQDENTTAYVRTVATLDEGGTYLVSISHEGDVEFRINGRVVHEGSRYTGGEEVLHWHVDLPAGDNLFAFKVSNREETSSVSCAISDIDGSQASGISLDPARQLGILQTADLNVKPVAASFLELVADGASERPFDREAQFWNLERVRRFAPPDSTSALCDTLSRRFEDCALLQLATAYAYGAASQEDELEQRMDAAAALAPELAPAVLHVAARDFERKRFDSARAVAEGVLQRAPQCREALDLRLGCLREQHLLEDMRTAAERVVELLPDDPIGYSYLAAHADARGLSTEQKRFRTEMIKRLPTQMAILAKYVESAKEEDYKEMEGELRRFMKLAPDSAVLMERYVEALLARDRQDTAYEAVVEGLRSFPQSIPLLYYRALFAEGGYDFDTSTVAQYFPDGKRTLTDEELESMWSRGHAPTRVISIMDEDDVLRWLRARCNRAAADILDDALAIDPGNFALRDKARALRGLPSLRTLMPDPDQSAIVAMRVPESRFADEDAVVLTERKRRLAFDKHASVVDYCLAVQVLNEEGVRRWENYRVDVNPYAADIVYLESKTIKPGGAEFEATTGLANVLFKNVEPGDIIFLHYQSTAHVSGALSGNFWDAHLFSFHDPCLESVYTLTAPGDRDVSVALHNESAATDSLSATSETLDDGFVRREWHFSSPPKISTEPGAASPLSYLPWLDVTTIDDWGTVAKWYSGLADGQAEITRRVRNKAEELTAGAAGDEQEEIARILAFVSDDITYQSIPFFQSAHIPREADEVLRHRFGDCKDKCTLMESLLHASGIEDCFLALVAVGSDQDVSFLPSPRFDHVVVARALPGGGYRWYDPTVRFPDPDQVPASIVGAPALVVREGENGLTTITGSGICERPRTVESRVALKDDGSVSVERRSTYTCIDETSPRRAHLETVSREALEDETLAALAVSCPGVELLSLEVGGAERADEPLVYDYAFSAPNVFAVTGDILSGSLPTDSHLNEAFGAVVAKKDRASPVDLGALSVCERTETAFEYPAGFEIVATPEPSEFEFDGCHYSTRYEPGDHALVVTRETSIAGMRVDAADYPRFKSFLESILQDMRTPLLLRRSR